MKIKSTWTQTVFPTDNFLKVSRLAWLCLLMVLSVSHVQAMTSAEREALTKWKAGAIVSRQAVEEFGMKNCFKAEQIPDDVWQRMQGKSYKKNPYIGRNDLRHIRVLHWGADDKIHLGEMICNKIIADKLVTIFRKLFDNKYAIERMVLPDEYDGDDERQMQKNNSSCFCYRAVAGSKTLSKHARGLAVDINPLYNPYVKKRGNVIVKIQPTTARDYEDRTKKFPFKIDKSDLCYRLFIEQGFRWGGAWRTVKDYQHFEY